MTVMNRMGKLFQADVHGILDQLEDPVTSAKQAVREMEEAVHEDEKQLGMLQKRTRHLEALAAESRKLLPELDSQIQLAMRSGNEELLRTLVRRKLEEEARLREIEFALGKLRASSEEVTARLNGRREQLAEIIKKLEVFVEPAHLSGLEGGKDMGRRVRPVTDDDVEVALLKLRKGGSHE